MKGLLVDSDREGDDLGVTEWDREDVSQFYREGDDLGLTEWDTVDVSQYRQGTWEAQEEAEEESDEEARWSTTAVKEGEGGKPVWWRDTTRKQQVSERVDQWSAGVRNPRLKREVQPKRWAAAKSIYAPLATRRTRRRGTEEVRLHGGDAAHGEGEQVEEKCGDIGGGAGPGDSSRTWRKVEKAMC